MNLLLDQGLPRSAADLMRAAGINAEHVGNLGLFSASDARLLDIARQRNAVMVTLDADFHALLAASGARQPSVIRIRIEGLKGPQVAKLLANIVATARVELEAGAAVSVTPHQIRIRLLPIRR